MDQDERARFESLYRENVRPLLAYARTRTDSHNAHDAVSSTFLVAWRRLDELPSEPLPWLIGVARRVLADQHRSDARRRSLSGRVAHAAATSRAAVDDVAEVMVLTDSIRRALGRLRPGDRELLTLVAWHGLSTEQLAVALGCSKSVASLRLHRARRRFAKNLECQDQPTGAAQRAVRPAKEIP